MVLFTCNVKKIKSDAHKNGDIEGKCKLALNVLNYCYFKIN